MDHSTSIGARVFEAVRLAVSALAVLGTASLLFVLTFRERSYEPPAAIRPIADDLLDLAADGGGRIWAAGHHGRILHSVDRGEHWQFAESGVDTPLSGVAFRDAKHGIAVGYGGVVLRTADGGETWARAASGVDVYLTAARFLGDGRALAVGEWGTVIESSDAGETWRTVVRAEHDFIINDFDVSERGDGWAVGELGQAMETADGGRTWSYRRLGTEERTFFTVDVVGPGDVWIGGTESLLAHTTDGGRSWQEISAPCAPTQILRLRFAAERGYAVGRRCVAVTEDGGRSWRRSRLAERVEFSWLYGLYVTADEVLAAGYGQAIFRAGRDDSSWTRLAGDRG